jgi:hypothetical protein
MRLYRLTLDMPARNTQPRYNICRTTNIDVLIERDGNRDRSFNHSRPLNFLLRTYTCLYQKPHPY